ncbi:MAG: hypothetical protein EG828_07170 [Deltaproteobacteria bacterium]|nr:hypothetical protein [Deltaproteobacteria bacterium]
MNKSNVFYLLTLLAVSAMLLCTVPVEAASVEAQRHMDRGQAAIEMAKTPEDLEDAITEFQQAKALAPDWPDPYYHLGLIQDKLERYDDALLSLMRYLQLAPRSPDAPQVQQLVNRIEYKKEKAEKERRDPKNLVGVWWVNGEIKEGPGLFYRFEIRNNDGIVEGALRAFAVSEQRGLSGWPSFVPVQWDGELLVIPHTRYYYCDKSVQKDCCATDATLSLTMIAKNALKGTLRIAHFKDRDGIVSPESVMEFVWKRVASGK